MSPNKASKSAPVKASAYLFLWGLTALLVGEVIFAVGYNIHWDSLLRSGRPSAGVMLFGGVIMFFGLIWCARGLYRLAKNIDFVADKLLSDESK